MPHGQGRRKVGASGTLCDVTRAHSLRSIGIGHRRLMFALILQLVAHILLPLYVVSVPLAMFSIVRLSRALGDPIGIQVGYAAVMLAPLINLLVMSGVAHRAALAHRVQEAAVEPFRSNVPDEELEARTGRP